MKKLKIELLILVIIGLFPFSVYAVEDTMIVIHYPSDNYLTNISEITIMGETEPDAILNLNGNLILNNNGSFLENVTVVEGINQIIVEAQKNSNISKAVVNITLDTALPEIAIISPNRTHINYTYLNITYTSNASDIENYAILSNNSLLGMTNKTYYPLDLTEGTAFIEVRAVDKAGNTGMAGINITVDLTPPFIEIIKPAVNETIKTRFLEMAGITEPDANISVNGVNLANYNGTWNTTLVLPGLKNIFRVESTDKAGNNAEKSVNIDFINPSINFSMIGKFEGKSDAILGKHVSFLFDMEASAFKEYSINDLDSTTLWFNKITIKNFKPDNSSISGPIAKYQQNRKFGERHSIDVEIHNNKMGTMFIDIRQFEDIYGKVAQYLMNRPREKLKINVSIEKNVTIERKGSGNLPPLYINESWKALPEITFELPDDVNVIGINNGFRLLKNDNEAYLFRANYAGGSSDFTIQENKLVAKVNNSLLVFRQLPRMNLTGGDILDGLISQGISDGIIGAEFFVNSAGSYDAVTFGDLKISAGFPDADTMELNISSESMNGTVVAVGMSGKIFNNLSGKNLTIRFDGNRIYEASSYQDIMDISNDFGRSEYLLAMGSNGAMVLVSIPSFSPHIVSFKFEESPETYADRYGSSIAGPLNFLSAGLFMFLPSNNRELTFSLRWFVIVLITYVIIKIIIRKKNVRRH